MGDATGSTHADVRVGRPLGRLLQDLREALRVGAALERVRDHERALARPDVAARGLPQALRVAGEVQEVVADLERDPQRRSEARDKGTRFRTADTARSTACTTRSG